MVRALASHHCRIPSSMLRLHVTCGLSLLVLCPAPRGFSSGTPVSPFPEKPVFNLIVLNFICKVSLISALAIDTDNGVYYNTIANGIHVE